MQCMINDLPIFYEEYGQGKPILCLHGFTEDHKSMTGCLEPVFKDMTGYRRIYLDMPGMGKTPGADWVKNADIMLDVLKKFVKEVIGEEEFLLVGTSYGGYMALGMAHDAKMKIGGMFLFGPAVVADFDNRKLPEVEDDDLFVEDGMDEVLESFGDTGFYSDSVIVMTAETWRRYQEEFLPSYKVYDRDFTKKFRENGYALSCESELSKLQFKKPVTVLAGRQDDSTGYEDPWDMLKHLPKFTFVALDGTGHLLPIENPDIFNAMLKDWLRRVSICNV